MAGHVCWHHMLVVTHLGDRATCNVSPYVDMYRSDDVWLCRRWKVWHDTSHRYAGAAILEEHSGALMTQGWARIRCSWGRQWCAGGARAQVQACGRLVSGSGRAPDFRYGRGEGAKGAAIEGHAGLIVFVLVHGQAVICKAPRWAQKKLPRQHNGGPVFASDEMRRDEAAKKKII